MDKLRRVLILGPHTDDGEFGCGGSMARLIEEGSELYYAAFSIAEESVPDSLPKNILETEIQESTAALGMKPENLILHKFPVRHFPAHRQEILELLVKIRNEIIPDLVLLPASTDIHQDHQVISAEGIRAFKQTRILGYELPWNNFTLTNSCHIVLQERHLDVKLKAIRCYRSQVEAGRVYADDSFIRGLARTRGIQVGADFAESFEMIRWII